ncbi:MULTISPECIES: M23 family metallopeptidase [unclassified Isoptericola]|uniref:M23 family metallopeptidase n=1 Tax=unclassified Isoptericola TaxID=2623355 RepID=UPI00365AB367
MKRLILAGAAAAVVAAPMAAVPLVALTMAPGATASCLAPELVVGTVPDHLDVTTADGTHVRLGRHQLGHAATIVTVGVQIDGVGRDGVLVALMAALTESRLLMYANTTAYPESASFPHDADGADHDSLGIFQMRPAAGWGTVADLMDPAYQARAFFGGPSGPNTGSPRGLLDVPGWASLPKAAAAQAVEVSAYPDRYAAWEPAARQILAELTSEPSSPGTASPAPGDSRAAVLPVVTATVFPLPAGTWTRTSGYGMRLNPVLGIRRLHAGVDLAAPAGTPVLATATGRVTYAGTSSGLGNHIIVEHHVDGQEMASVYGHLRDGGIHVRAGDVVAAGQRIGDVGSTGNSTGPHLHFEIRPGGATGAAVDPDAWLAATDETQDAERAAGAIGPCQVTP